MYTNLEKALEEIRNKVLLKDEIMNKTENAHTLVTFQAQKIDTDVKATKQKNVSLAEYVVKTEHILKQVFLYVKKYDKSLESIINDMNIFMKLNNEKSEPDEYIEIKEIQNWNVQDGIYYYYYSKLKELSILYSVFIGRFIIYTVPLWEE